MGKLSSEEIAEVVELYVGGQSAPTLAARFGVSRQAIEGLLHRRKIEMRTVAKLNDAQKAAIVERYQAGESSEKIASDFELSGMSVRGVLRRRGVQIRSTYFLNEEAFDRLTDDAAYWIGFLFADGCVSYRPNRKPTVSVGLAKRDRAHLVKLRAFLGSTHAITDLPSVGSCTLQVRSERLAERLVALGRYSGSIDSRLASSRHFWRGVLDGDGSIGDYSGKAQIRLVGSRRVLEAFNGFLKTHGVTGLSVRPHKSIYVIGTTGNSAARIMNLLYHDTDTFLHRKGIAVRKILSVRNGT